jgi:ELWxxDGT repeat protein
VLQLSQIKCDNVLLALIFKGEIMKGMYISIVLFLSTLLLADTSHLVKNINRTTKSAFDYHDKPKFIEYKGDTYFFAAMDSQNIALYQNSVTTNTTTSLVEFNAESTLFNDLAVFDEKLFFTVDNGSDGLELYVNDTGAITLFKDLNPGPEGSDVRELTVSGNTLYFIANDNLYKSDGTAANTEKVSSFTSSEYHRGRNLYAVGDGKVIFSANDGTHGHEPWFSDGVNTYMLKDIKTDSTYYKDSYPQHFTLLNGWIYFTAYDESHGCELWRTDGIDGGVTELVVDIAAGASSSVPGYLRVMGSAIYFRANSNELWKVDSSGASLIMTMSSNISSITVMNSNLYIYLNNKTLYKSDGSAAHTTVIENTLDIREMEVFNNLLYFSASSSTGEQGYELYKTNGSDHNASLVADIQVGDGSSDPDTLTATSQKLYFTADDAIHAREVWTVNLYGDLGLLKDINTNEAGSHPHDMFYLKNKMIFVADDGIHGEELWISDGSEAGTQLLKDINPGYSGSEIDYVYKSDSLLFFRTNTKTNLTRAHASHFLWRSDGTSAGTFPLGELDVASEPFASINNTLYFVAYDSATGYELYKSDGTVDGTVLLKDIRTDSQNSNIHNLTAVKNRVFFFADDGSGKGEELWVTDGTTDGTQFVKDINPNGDALENFGDAKYAALNNTLFFFANDDAHGIELWKSDGTESGTVMVKDINPVSNNSNGDNAQLIELDGEVFFIADDGVHDYELWKSDGTESGTVMVKDINADDSGVSPQHRYNQLTKVNDLLYFIGDDNTNGREVWKSDGTEEGTSMVKNIHPSSSNLSSFVAIGDLLYFQTTTSSSPNSIWKTDGTESGTTTVAGKKAIEIEDYATGAACPSLYFQGADYQYDGTDWSADDEAELWMVTGDAHCQNKLGFMTSLYLLLF